MEEKKIKNPLEILATQYYNATIISQENRDYETGARIEEVPRSELGNGVLGLYNSITHTIKIVKDLGQKLKNYVFHHERWHAKGKINEVETDRYAGAEIGYSFSKLGDRQDILSH